MGFSKAMKRLGLELGVDAVWLSSTDLKLLILTRMIRMFAYGGTTIILVLFLSALGIPDTRIGLFMTLTLVGDIGVSTILTIIGDGMGVRFTMAVGSVLMMGSGIAFAVLDNYVRINPQPFFSMSLEFRLLRHVLREKPPRFCLGSLRFAKNTANYLVVVAFGG